MCVLYINTSVHMYKVVNVSAILCTHVRMSLYTLMWAVQKQSIITSTFPTLIMLYIHMFCLCSVLVKA